MRITRKDLQEMIDSINQDLESEGKDWHLKYYSASGYHDVKKQYNGQSGNWNVTPDCATSAKDIYIWLRGFQARMYER